MERLCQEVVAVKSFVGVLAMGAMIVLISACGVNRQASSYQPAANHSSQGGSTISQKTIRGVGTVLVSQTGMTLYSPEQEAYGHILCTAACTRFWHPLVLSKGAKSLTKGPGVPGKLAVVDRPDGAKQVAFDGKPLYEFVEDGSPGDTKGDNFQDNFGGQQFSWQVVTVGKAPSANGSESQNHGGYGGGY
jgi:predicted lipoprotein with Yx(FWY)xxD motif